jgi:hypothetical protein
MAGNCTRPAKPRGVKVADVTDAPTALTLRLAIAGVAMETVLVWAYVGYLIYADAGAPGGWRVIGYFALYAVAFAGLTWALVVRRRWVRAPLIVLQLMLAAVGLGFLSNGAAAVGVLIIALAVGCVGLLIVPATRAALAAR